MRRLGGAARGLPAAPEAQPPGRRVWIKHLPDVQLSLEARVWDRIIKRYEPWFHATAGDLPTRPRLIREALVYASQAPVLDRHRLAHAHEVDLDGGTTSAIINSLLTNQIDQSEQCKKLPH
jgi:hypothetical protein